MAYELCSVANVKAYLGKSYTDDDALLLTFVQAVSARFESMISRNILARSYTDILNGYWGRVIIPRQYPIVSVSSLLVDGTTVSVAPTIADTGYFATEHVVYLRHMFVSTGYANVEITYNAGYSTVPADIQQACAEWAALQFKERTHIGNASQSMSGISVSYLPSVVPQSVLTVASAYKRMI